MQSEQIYILIMLRHLIHICRWIHIQEKWWKRKPFRYQIIFVCLYLKKKKVSFFSKKNLNISMLDKTTPITFYVVIYVFYIYFACLFVCLSVCLYPINVRTAEPIGPKFCVWPCNRMTQGRFMDAHNYKKVLIFVKLKKKSANFFCYAFILYKKNMLTERATIKIEIEVGCKAP